MWIRSQNFKGDNKETGWNASGTQMDVVVTSGYPLQQSFGM